MKNVYFLLIVPLKLFMEDTVLQTVLIGKGQGEKSHIHQSQKTQMRVSAS